MSIALNLQQKLLCRLRFNTRQNEKSPQKKKLFKTLTFTSRQFLSQHSATDHTKNQEEWVPRGTTHLNQICFAELA